MQRTGTARLPLRRGKASKWLFTRMAALDGGLPPLAWLNSDQRLFSSDCPILAGRKSGKDRCIEENGEVFWMIEGGLHG
jgi:hypothetical protein